MAWTTDSILWHTSYIFADTFEQSGYGRQQVSISHQSAGNKPLACRRSVTIMLERVWQKGDFSMVWGWLVPKIYRFYQIDMCDYKWLKFGNVPQIKYHSEHNFEYCLPSKSPLLKSLPKTEGHPWSQISFEIHSWTYTHQSPLILADRRQWELEYRVKCEIALSSQDFHIDTHTAPTPCPIRMNKLYSQTSTMWWWCWYSW